MLTIRVHDDGSIDGYMTVRDAAKKWGVTLTVVRGWIHRKKFRTVKIGDGTYISVDTEKPQTKVGRPKRRDAV